MRPRLCGSLCFVGGAGMLNLNCDLDGLTFLASGSKIELVSNEHFLLGQTA